jgi:hypothetical protein
VNYIQRQVDVSQDDFSLCWPRIASLRSPLSGSVLVPVTERRNGPNSRAAWLLDTDAKIDLLAHVSGVGVYGIAARVFRLKDAFRPYNTITFRFNRETRQGELQSIIRRIKAGCLVPSFIVSVQLSEFKGVRHISIVDTRKMARAIMLRSDRAKIQTSKNGVPFFSVDVSSLPEGAAWTFCDEEIKEDLHDRCILDLMREELQPNGEAA